MMPEQKARIKEYARKIQWKGRIVLIDQIPEEVRDLDRLLQGAAFEIEFGYWIYGEE